MMMMVVVVADIGGALSQVRHRFKLFAQVGPFPPHDNLEGQLLLLSPVPPWGSRCRRAGTLSKISQLVGGGAKQIN